MNSIELLKQELADQKSAIETKGGVVPVANTNVSPAEITQGIKTIPVLDMSLSTATETDVLSGKTFYSGNNNLKTGTLVIPEGSSKYEDFLEYIVFEKATTSSPDLEIQIPDYVTRIKEYLFNNCQYKCNVYLNSGLQEIGAYAFYQAYNTTVHNFDKATGMTTVGLNSFRGAKGIDLTRLPSSLTSIGNYSFADCATYCDGIVVPGSLTTIGTYAFNCSTITPVQYIDLSQTGSMTYGLYMFSNIKCLSNLEIPEGATTLSSYFNYNGSMKSVTFPTTFTKTNPYAFACKEATPLEDLITESYTFLSTTPPSINSTCFSIRLLERTNATIKFYVPDESLEAYKAVTNLRNFINHIYPMSQKV